MKFIFEHTTKGYRWRLLAKNGTELAAGKPYPTKRQSVQRYQEIIGKIKDGEATVDYQVREIAE